MLSGAPGAWFEEGVLGSQGRLCGKQLILDVPWDLGPLQQQAHNVYHRQAKSGSGVARWRKLFSPHFLQLAGHSPSNDIGKMRQPVAHFSCQH